ncbi:hypothetical protein ACV229_09420 [Burkholderia sp. MR1-5-21]
MKTVGPRRQPGLLGANVEAGARKKNGPAVDSLRTRLSAIADSWITNLAGHCSGAENCHVLARGFIRQTVIPIIQANLTGVLRIEPRRA